MVSWGPPPPDGAALDRRQIGVLVLSRVPWARRVPVARRPPKGPPPIAGPSVVWVGYLRPAAPAGAALDRRQIGV